MELLSCVCVPLGRYTPSITYNGLLDELIELKPRIRILVCPPGRPELVLTNTPAILPASCWLTDAAGRSCNCVALTTPTDPVRSVFLAVPYPITTTSFKVEAALSGSNVTLIADWLPTVTSCGCMPT